MKRIIILFFVFISFLCLTGCALISGREFKTEYESLNGKENSSGKVHRTVSIPWNNPYEKVSASKIIDMIDNKETFYVYFGDGLCPWCRSVIEKSIEVAKENKIKKMYYVKIWDNDGNEILRSKYKLSDNNEIELVKEGTNDYYKLLERLDNVLSDYNLISSTEEEIFVGEKRIYAPNFIYIKDGKAEKLIDGVSEKQTDARGKLTETILKDQEDIFNKFFN